MGGKQRRWRVERTSEGLLAALEAALRDLPRYVDANGRTDAPAADRPEGSR